jgi:lysophospholipid acyltransferase (LPLAT)-like uncharacterized protein
LKFVRRLFWRILEWPIALFWFSFAVFVRATARVEMDGSEPDGAAVYVNWHRYQSFLIPHHGAKRRWMLVSPAPPVEPIARFCKLMGLRLVRGTSGERGKEAVAELIAKLRAGDSVALAVDGPRGPAFHAKRGCIDLARGAGVPLAPLAYRCSRAHEFRWRWDRMLMPLPFAKIAIVCGPPIDTAGSDAEVLARVEAALQAIDGGQSA